MEMKFLRKTEKKKKKFKHFCGIEALFMDFNPIYVLAQWSEDKNTFQWRYECYSKTFLASLLVQKRENTFRMNHSLHVARNTQTREALEQSGI
jgi:hypothetical protein